MGNTGLAQTAWDLMTDSAAVAMLLLGAVFPNAVFLVSDSRFVRDIGASPLLLNGLVSRGFYRDDVALTVKLAVKRPGNVLNDVLVAKWVRNMESTYPKYCKRVIILGENEYISDFVGISDRLKERVFLKDAPSYIWWNWLCQTTTRHVWPSAEIFLEKINEELGI
jgi:hypothetical protein